MIKIVYFDEDSARDYIDIVNGGSLSSVQEDTKERATKILAEIEAQVGNSFNVLNYIKATLQGNFSGGFNREVKSIVEKQLSNTLLTDYITTATKDINIEKFDGVVYASENSMSKYKMYSPYTVIVPKDQVPIDLEKLNEALENARGYYELLLDMEDVKKVLRFNSKAFRNNYSLSDLTKMKLKFYAVKVGTCTLDSLDMSKEFDISKPVPTAQDILNIGELNEDESLCVYDVIIAGVENE